MGSIDLYASGQRGNAVLICSSVIVQPNGISGGAHYCGGVATFTQQVCW